MSSAVSVVIPLYQTERYIGATLASVLAQTFTDFEVIVVDDGSRDRGPEIACATGDARVRVVMQANRGLSGARNTGIREARAPLIAFLDADDLWTPTKLEQHVAHFASDPCLGVSFSSSTLIDEDGRTIGIIRAPACAPVSAEDVFCFNPVGNGSAPVVRRAALDDVAFHDPRYDRLCWFDESFRQSEDVECWMRVAVLATWRIAGIEAPLTLYRLNAAGLSADVTKQFASWRMFRAKVASYAPSLDARVGDRAEAYQGRYLARRAVRAGDGVVALRLLRNAVRLHPRLLVDDPARDLVSIAASVACAVLPSSTYTAVRRHAGRLKSSQRESPA